MGYSSGDACFPTQEEAALDWCRHLQSGAYGATCTGCTGTSCTVQHLTNTGTLSTTAITAGAPACEVPTPLEDAMAISGAIAALWITVAAAMAVVHMFRVPHAD